MSMADQSTQAGYLYRSFIQIPVGLAWGPDGNLYIADWAGRHVVRRSPDGTLDDLGLWRYLPMWDRDGPRGLAFDNNGVLYVSDHTNIYRVAAEGNVETLPGVQGTPVGSIAISPEGDFYYTDRGGGRVLKWNPDGTSQVIASGIDRAENLAFGLDGTLYVTQQGQGVIQIDVTSGKVTGFFSRPLGSDPIFVTVDPTGDIWLRGIGYLYRVSPDGTEKPFVVHGMTISGNSGPIRWHTSAGIAFDDEGGLWIASYNSKIIRLNPPASGQEAQGYTISVIEPGLAAFGVDIDTGPGGELYVYNANARELWRISPEGVVETLLNLDTSGAVSVAVDERGGIYLGLPTGEIVRLEAEGNLSHYATMPVASMVFGADGNLYAAIGEYGKPKSVVRITGTDEYITLFSAIEDEPLGSGDVYLAAGPQGGLYVVHESNWIIYFVDFEGNSKLVTDFRTMGPGAITVSPDGIIYAIPFGVAENTVMVFRIDPGEGQVLAYAAGAFGDAWAMAVSPDGQWLYVAESGAIDKIPLAPKEQ